MILPVGSNMQLEVIEERRNRAFPQLEENVCRAVLPNGVQFDRVVVVTDSLYQRMCERLARLEALSEAVARDPLRL